MPVALISGVSGQDGSYMAEYLISMGYKVYGITRDPSVPFGNNIKHLQGKLNLIYSSYQLYHLIDILKNIRPDEIYNLAGQSYVSKSWEMVEETIQSQALLTSRFLEAISLSNLSIKFVNASSSEIFTPGPDGELKESSRIDPYNPYGCAKSFAHCMVDAYRNSKNLFAVNAILFPHESPRRHNNFAFKKIINSAVRIKNGSKEKLELGNLHVYRDWGYAPPVVVAMHSMLMREIPENLCLCTGELHSVEDVVSTTFKYLGLAWQEHVLVNDAFVRPNEPKKIFGNPTMALEKLGWRQTLGFEDLIAKIVDYEMKLILRGGGDRFDDEAPIFGE